MVKSLPKNELFEIVVKDELNFIDFKSFWANDSEPIVVTLFGSVNVDKLLWANALYPMDVTELGICMFVILLA